MSNDFAIMIRNGRKKRGLTLKSASALTGISIGYLCDFEKGRGGNPKMDFIYAAANAYGINPDVLCVAAKRIPRDIFDKIVEHPSCYAAIRDMEV